MPVRKFRLRRIESVPKPQGGKYTKWQNGTWLAHWASRLPHPEKLDQGESNFVYRDLTSVIEQLVQRAGRWVSVATSQSLVCNADIPGLR